MSFINYTYLQYPNEAVLDGHAGDLFDVGGGLLDAVGKATFEKLKSLGRAARVKAVLERLEGRPVVALVDELLVQRGLLHYVPAHALALLQSFYGHQLLVHRALLMYIAALRRAYRPAAQVACRARRYLYVHTCKNGKSSFTLFLGGFRARARGFGAKGV